MSFPQESSTLPRGFRFHHHERPTTPEPLTTEIIQPSPPRQRLKLRRRNAPTFTAPTDGFMASVAAASADTPLPTIEIADRSDDADMADFFVPPQLASGYLSPSLSYRSTPPKTPMPHFPNDAEDGGLRPHWSMTPHEEVTRPDSSLSNASDWSDDSYFSTIRTSMSRPSEDGSCSSPESDSEDPFTYASVGKLSGQELWASPAAPPYEDDLVRRVHRKARGALWSKDMSNHLWFVYQVYLQDPTVTPFRIGASAVPPEGVIHRVAREAKRSWKGPRVEKAATRAVSRASSINSIELATHFDSTKSGSLTPTAEDRRKVYVQWYHSSAATRSHLRDLCKRRDTTSVRTHRHFQSKSPTPFSQQKKMKYRLPTPSHSRISSFSTKDISLSLTTCSAESMQPDGPLAKLGASDQNAIQNQCPILAPEDNNAVDQNRQEATEGRARRLGSPFSSRLGGSLSSRSLSRPRFRSERGPSSGQLLASPFPFDQPRSLHGTQKRRAQYSLEEEMSSASNSGLRASILDHEVFNGPSVESQHRRVRRSRGFSLGDEALRTRVPVLFTLPPRAPESSAPIVLSSSPSQPGSSTRMPSLLPAFEPIAPSSAGPSASESSFAGPNTFPRRLFHPLPSDSNSTIRRRAYATMHQSRHSIESFDFGRGPLLQSKLEILDNKLAEIRDREQAGRSRSREQ